MSRDQTPEHIAQRRARLQRDREQRRIEMAERTRTRGGTAQRAAARPRATGTPAAGRRAAASSPVSATRVRVRRPLPARIVGGTYHAVRAFVTEVADIVASLGSVVSGGARVLGVGTAAIPARRKPQAAPARRRRTPAEERAAAKRRAQAQRRLRWGAVAVAAAALLVGWFTVPAMDAFRVTHVEVMGASSLPDLQVRRTIDPLLAHETVYTVDAAAIERKLERLPFVRDARVERHFPGGISVRIHEYRPLALGVAGGGQGWLVARDGRVLAKARIGDWTGRVPVVRLQAERVEPGIRVGDEPALRLLRAIPDDFVGTFEAVHMQGGSLVGVLADGTQVRFGRARELPVKIAAAQRVIAFWAADRSESTAGELQYVDVSVPASPAVKPR